MEQPDSPFVKRICTRCGVAALVPSSDAEYVCDACHDAEIAIGDDPGERTVSSFWSESRTNAGALTVQAFGALDDVFNPAAARARESLKADHERQLPIPSPGDDALRSGSIVIKVPKPPAEDN